MPKTVVKPLMEPSGDTRRMELPGEVAAIGATAPDPTPSIAPGANVTLARDAVPVSSVLSTTVPTVGGIQVEDRVVTPKEKVDITNGKFWIRMQSFITEEKKNSQG